MGKFVTLLGTGALLTIMPASPAYAGSSIVIDEGTCVGFIPVNGGLGPLLFGGRVHVVTKNAWTTLTCHLDIPPGMEPAKVARATGVQCFTPLGSTYDTRMQASPGGRAVGTCRIRN